MHKIISQQFLREGLESGSLPPIYSGSYVAESPTRGRGRLFLQQPGSRGSLNCSDTGRRSAGHAHLLFYFHGRRNQNY